MSAHTDEIPDHTCDAGDFDRTLCPEPCNSMHSYCTTCGELQDVCALSTHPDCHEEWKP